jgi:hypothetical protein
MASALIKNVFGSDSDSESEDKEDKEEAAAAKAVLEAKEAKRAAKAEKKAAAKVAAKKAGPPRNAAQVGGVEYTTTWISGVKRRRLRCATPRCELEQLLG